MRWILIQYSPDPHSLTIAVYNLCILLPGTCPKRARFTIPVHFFWAPEVLDSLKKSLDLFRCCWRRNVHAVQNGFMYIFINVSWQIKSKTDDFSVQISSAVRLVAWYHKYLRSNISRVLPEIWKTSFGETCALPELLLPCQHFKPGSGSNVGGRSEDPLRALLAKQNQSWAPHAYRTAAVRSAGLPILGW